MAFFQISPPLPPSVPVAGLVMTWVTYTPPPVLLPTASSSLIHPTKGSPLPGASSPTLPLELSLFMPFWNGKNNQSEIEAGCSWLHTVL